MIFTIHYIRGIAALLVVLFHFRADLNKVYTQQDLGDLLFGSGMAGVDLFFIISGFIIVVSTSRVESNSGVKFILRRVFRIYPLLIFSVFMFWILMTDMKSFTLLFKSIVPMQLNYNEPSPYYGYNMLNPAWTLTYEIYFYAVFFVGMLISHRYMAIISSSLILLTMVAVQKYYGHLFINANLSVDASPDNSLLPLIKLASSPMLIEFVIGMVLAELYIKIPAARSRVNLWPIVLLGCTIYFILFASKAYFSHGILGFGAWSLFVIIPFLIYEKTAEVKPNRILAFLGDISYPLYITHIVTAVIVSNYNAYVPAYSYATGVSMLLIYLTCSILFAYICHVFIEKPMHRLSRSIIRQLDSKRVHL